MKRGHQGGVGAGGIPEPATIKKQERSQRGREISNEFSRCSQECCHAGRRSMLAEQRGAGQLAPPSPVRPSRSPAQCFFAAFFFAGFLAAALTVTVFVIVLAAPPA